MLVRLFAREFPYWAMSTLFEGRLIELMGADREVIAGLTPEERTWVRRLIESMGPASIRSQGARFDNLAPAPGDRIAGIRAPTLVVQAEDDRLQLFENARFAQATIPDARLLRFERGGHLVMILEAPAVRQAIRRHLIDELSVEAEIYPAYNRIYSHVTGSYHPGWELWAEAKVGYTWDVAGDRLFLHPAPGIGFGIFQSNPPPEFFEEIESPIFVPQLLVGARF
jgi:hypothetical protein